MLSPSYGQVTHVLLTRSPLSSQWKQASIEKTVRLACIRHAASVRPEPGSNSHVMWALVQKPSWKAEKLLISCWLYVCDTMYRLRLLRPKSKLPAHLVRSFFVQFSKVNRASRITWLLTHVITASFIRQAFFEIFFKKIYWRSLEAATFISYHHHDCMSTIIFNCFICSRGQLLNTTTRHLSLSTFFRR